MKNKKMLNLCFRYATNCKYCPRNNKCEEEIKKVEYKPKKKKFNYSRCSVIVAYRSL